MDILCWNCRGSNNSETEQALRDLVIQSKPKVVFLSETHCSSSERLLELQQLMGFDHAYQVPSLGASGGLGLFWFSEIDLRLRDFSPNFIDVEIGSVGAPDCWRFTGIYGFPVTSERYRTWQLIRSLHDASDLPWLICGDFNEILFSHEKSGGRLRQERQMAGFREAVYSCNLRELGSVGSKFTWSDSVTKCRLDRGLSSQSWLGMFPFSRVRVLPPSQSDHSPLLVEIRNSCETSSPPRRRRFRFEEYWLDNEECAGVIESSWASEVSGQPMFQLTSKVLHSRIALQNWQRATFGQRQKDMMIIRRQLEDILNRPFDSTLVVEKQRLSTQLQIFLSQENSFWRQRTRTRSLVERW